MRHALSCAVVALATMAFTPALSAKGKHYVSAEEVKANTEKVMSKIEWGEDLESMQERAKKQRKLVFWLQLVGDLDGGL